MTARPETDRTFSVMSKKPLYGPMMDTIKPYREKLMQAKRQLDEAWKGESGLQPIVTNTETNDVLELKESLSRVSNMASLRKDFGPEKRSYMYKNTLQNIQLLIILKARTFFKVFRD